MNKFRIWHRNSRPFKKISGSRLSWFETMEKGAIKPLPRSRYVYSEWKKARVYIDCHVELKGHYYSVPHQLQGEEVDLRYTATTCPGAIRSIWSDRHPG